MARKHIPRAMEHCRVLPAVVFAACTLCLTAQSGAAQAPSEPSIEAVDAIADAADSSTLPKAVALRLRDRSSNKVLAESALMSTVRRYAQDVQVLKRIAGLGYADMDTFLVPSARVGGTLLIVQFQPLSAKESAREGANEGADARAEAFAMFRALEAEVLATRSEFVGLRGSVHGLKSNPDRYDWLFWHTPQNNWVFIKTAPREYFEAKLKQSKQPASGTAIDHESTITYLAQLAHIDFAEGEQDDGAAKMREALQYIDAAPAESRPGAVLQLDVLRTLAFAAANEGDETQLAQYIARYASFTSKSGAALDNVPVRITGAAGYWDSFLDSEVTVEFDVLPDGTTANTVVLASNSSATFTAAVRQATARWRFFPAVADGKVIVSKRKWKHRTNANNSRTRNERRPDG